MKKYVYENCVYVRVRWGEEERRASKQIKVKRHNFGIHWPEFKSFLSNSG